MDSPGPCGLILIVHGGKINLSFAGGFDLPRIQTENWKEKATFYDLLDDLRDMATWSIMERLQDFPQGHFTNDLNDKMHGLMQDLMYFRNVDGSFGEPMTQQTFQ